MIRIAVHIGSSNKRILLTGQDADNFVSDLLSRIRPTFDPQEDDEAEVILRWIKSAAQKGHQASIETLADQELQPSIQAKYDELKAGPNAADYTDDEHWRAARRFYKSQRESNINSRRIALPDPEDDS